MIDVFPDNIFFIHLERFLTWYKKVMAILKSAPLYSNFAFIVIRFSSGLKHYNSLINTSSINPSKYKYTMCFSETFFICRDFFDVSFYKRMISVKVTTYFFRLIGYKVYVIEHITEKLQLMVTNDSRKRKNGRNLSFRRFRSGQTGLDEHELLMFACPCRGYTQDGLMMMIMMRRYLMRLIKQFCNFNSSFSLRCKFFELFLYDRETEFIFKMGC